MTEANPYHNKVVADGAGRTLPARRLLEGGERRVCVCACVCEVQLQQQLKKQKTRPYVLHTACTCTYLFKGWQVRRDERGWLGGGLVVGAARVDRMSGAAGCPSADLIFVSPSV